MHLLDDSPSKIPEDPDFIEHRHDLALLSSLLVQLGKVGIPQETYFPNKWRSEGVKFPCWVVRNSTPFLLEQDRVTSQTLRMARHYWHWLNRNRHWCGVPLSRLSLIEQNSWAWNVFYFLKNSLFLLSWQFSKHGVAEVLEKAIQFWRCCKQCRKWRYSFLGGSEIKCI